MKRDIPCDVTARVQKSADPDDVLEIYCEPVDQETLEIINGWHDEKAHPSSLSQKMPGVPPCAVGEPAAV